MHFQLVQPNIFLQKYIKEFCFMEATALEATVMERVIPTENIQLMFHYKDPFVMYDRDLTPRMQPRTILSGLSNTFSDVSTTGETGVVFVQFFPESACHFFPFPLSEVENSSLDLTLLLHEEVGRVEGQLFEAKTQCERVTLIEQFLMNRFQPIPHSDGRLIQCGVQIIKQHRGQISAEKLADLLSVSPKTLDRKFSKWLGKATKQAIKLHRFQSVLKDLSTNKSQNMTEIAYSNGYYDQAHFIHDFKSYCGYTPGTFVEKYPDFQG